MFSIRSGKKVKVAKVILLGGSNVGKTTLIIRWKTGTYEDQVTPYSAIGAAFTSKNISYGADDVIKLNVWDTSGSERFDALTQLYYRDALAAVLCFDIAERGSLERARYWATRVKEESPACTIYLCATKVDILETDASCVEITDDECMAFKQEIGARSITRVSSKTGANIEQLFDNIALDLLTEDSITHLLHSETETASISLASDRGGEESCLGVTCTN